MDWWVLLSCLFCFILTYGKLTPHLRKYYNILLYLYVRFRFFSRLGFLFCAQELQFWLKILYDFKALLCFCFFGWRWIETTVHVMCILDFNVIQGRKKTPIYLHEVINSVRSQLDWIRCN